MNQEPFTFHIKGFCLADTVDCGQAFRFSKKPDGSFVGVAQGKQLCIRQEGDQLFFYDTSLSDFEKIWRRYFDLDTDYQAINESLCFQKTICASMEYAGGIRILRQDPWEALCSFIISQNNNIPRIKGIIERFCENFGDPIGEQCFAFPTAKRIAGLTVEELSPLRAGFRAKYLLDAAQRVESGEVDFTKIDKGTLKDGEEELRKIYGVGEKVAQCVLLFGFHKLNAFPVDTWIKKVLETYFPNGFPKRAQKYGGIAQQYLFHYIRNFEDNNN